MTQYFSVHPETPQKRLIQKAIEIIKAGGLVVYPTDSSYAIGCKIGEKKAIERLCSIRKIDKYHNFTLLCEDLSEIAQYSIVDNINYRLMKSLTPGPYTFILNASREVPKRLLNVKRKRIGVRIPDNEICKALLRELDEPLMTSTLMLNDDEHPLTDPYEIHMRLENKVDLIIDGGYSGHQPTTVVNLTSPNPEILRQGVGDIDWLKQH